MKVRRLGEQDAEPLWNLRLKALQSQPEAFGESVEEHRQKSIEEYGRRLQSGNDENFIVGAFDSDLVGMVGFYRDLRPKRRHRGTIWGMFVSQTVRGRGVGTALLNDAVGNARAIPGLRSLLLSVTATQGSARRLYISAGFRSFGLEPDALLVGDQYIDEEHMILSL